MNTIGRITLLALALAAPIALPAPAHADSSAASPGQDEVSLKNGGMVRGTVVALEPGTRILIQEVGAASPRAIPWGEVADVQRGKYPAAGQPGAAGPGYDAVDASGSEVAPRAHRPGMVKLHVDSPARVQVVEHVGTTTAQVSRYELELEHSAVVCGTPCDQTIDGSRGQEFAVEGDGVPRSETFTLSGHQGDAVLHVEPGSTAMVFGGKVMLYTGIGAAVGGALLAVLGATSDNEKMLPIGGAVIGGGSALVGGGIALLVLGDTDVELRPTTQTGSARPASVAPRYWAGEF